MTEKKRRLVKVNFVGIENLEGKVFDTTIKEEAIKAGIFEENKTYSPISIIVGEKELLQKVEDALNEMKEGEKRVVNLTPKDSFGERKTDLVRVVPLKNFHEQKINPFPGLVVRVANAIGRVQSVTSGRVRIDFNHPLAGRSVEYHVELVKEVSDKNEVMETIFEKYYSRIPNTKKEISQGVLTITLPKNLFKNLEEINKSISKIASGFEVELKFRESEDGDKEIELPEEVLNGSEHEKDYEHEHKNESTNLIKESEETKINSKENDLLKNKGPKNDLQEASGGIEENESPKSIHQLADEEKQKTTKKFVVSRDSATTIQRPKKIN